MIGNSASSIRGSLETWGLCGRLPMNSVVPHALQASAQQALAWALRSSFFVELLCFIVLNSREVSCCKCI